MHALVAFGRMWAKDADFRSGMEVKKLLLLFLNADSFLDAQCQYLSALSSLWGTVNG